MPPGGTYIDDFRPAQVIPVSEERIRDNAGWNDAVKLMRRGSDNSVEPPPQGSKIKM